MPVYDYDCAECGRRVEVIHGVHAPGPTHCPNCGGGPLRKAISAAAVHFKGSGWAKKERHATITAGASKSGEASGAGEGESMSADDAARDSKPKDKDTAASSDSGSADKAGDRRDTGELPAAASKSAGAGTGTATKTD